MSNYNLDNFTKGDDKFAEKNKNLEPTKSFQELFEQAQKEGVTRIDNQSDSSLLNKIDESQHGFDTVLDTAAKRYGLSVDKIGDSVPIGTMGEKSENKVEQGKEYKNMTEEKYREKQIAGLDKATKDFLASKNIKIEDLYKDANIPVENLNGMSVAIQGWKNNPDKFDAKFKNLQNLAKKNYKEVFGRIESKLGTDFKNNNPKLFEVGFVGLGKIGDKDYSEAGLKKLVEQAAGGKVSETEQYYMVKALMNAHGVDRKDPVPMPKPKPQPVVASTPTTGTNSYENYNTAYNPTSGFGNGNNIDVKGIGKGESGGKKPVEKKENEKVTVTASAKIGKSSEKKKDKNENKEEKFYDAKTKQYLTAEQWGKKYGTIDNLTTEQMAEKYGTMEATIFDPKSKKYLTMKEWASRYGTISPNENKAVSGQ